MLPVKNKCIFLFLFISRHVQLQLHVLVDFVGRTLESIKKTSSQESRQKICPDLRECNFLTLLYVSLFDLYWGKPVISF